MLQKGIYQHYKGLYYEIIDIAKHTETLEELVIYRALYGEYILWARPLTYFLTPVEVDGLKKPRFIFVEQPGSQINPSNTALTSQ